MGIMVCSLFWAMQGLYYHQPQLTSEVMIVQLDRKEGGRPGRRRVYAVPPFCGAKGPMNDISSGDDFVMHTVGRSIHKDKASAATDLDAASDASEDEEDQKPAKPVKP